jgi:hypothetical protein
LLDAVVTKDKQQPADVFEKTMMRVWMDVELIGK